MMIMIVREKKVILYWRPVFTASSTSSAKDFSTHRSIVSGSMTGCGTGSKHRFKKQIGL
jgi:hypothetical protein